MEKVAIITVSFNGHKDTQELLASARTLTTDHFNTKWFCIDNGSDKYLGDFIKETDNIEVLQTGKNLGFTGGYNFGIKYALNWGADYLFIINNDTLIKDNDIVTKLIRTINKNPKAAVVSPKILFAPGFEYHKDRYSGKDIGNVIWWAGGKFDWNNVLTIHRGLDQVDNSQYDQIGQTDMISGCCFMAKREAFEKAGLFEEKLFAYFEDVDFMLRLKKVGFKLFYNGQTSLYHKVSRTSGIGSPVTDYLLTRNRLYFGAKYASFRTKMALAREALKFFISGRVEQKKAVADFVLSNYGLPGRFAKDSLDPKYPVELSICIVNYKTKDLTIKLLESIDYKDSEIILLENASGDSFPVIVTQKIKFINSDKNLGFSAGYNKAIDYSKGRYILLLNSDIEAKKGSIKKLVDFAKNKNDNAVAVPKLILPNGKTQKSCFVLPTIANTITRKNIFFVPQKTKKVEGAVMAAFLIPRKVLNKVGKLWTKSFMYFEDIDYCRRLNHAGVPVYYIQNTTFLHHHGASSKKAAGKSTDFLVEASKAYHGQLIYAVITATLWIKQKLQSNRRYNKL